MIIFPQEVFAMEPEDVFKFFNPDTYISHELDGKPISKLDVPKHHCVGSNTRYFDPIQDRYELHEDTLDTQSFRGKLSKELYNSQSLYDKATHNLYVEAKSKQGLCTNEMPVYHKKVLDLYSKSKSSVAENSYSRHTKPSNSLVSKIKSNFKPIQ